MPASGCAAGRAETKCSGNLADRRSFFLAPEREREMTDYDPTRRNAVLATAALAGAALSPGRPWHKRAPTPVRRNWTASPCPNPAPDKTAGPVRPGRGSMLTGKVAVVTGAARGIGRAIAVELAANGADVVALDIAGPVSTASNAVPATPEELDETVRQIKRLRPARRGDAGRHPRHRRLAAGRRPGRARATARSTSSSPMPPSSAGCRCWRWTTPTGAT